MDKENKQDKDILEWIDLHREELPISSLFWYVHVLDKQKIQNKNNSGCIELGKYNAKVDRTFSFYKPYSKLFEI